jgi:hypothetical protein
MRSRQSAPVQRSWRLKAVTPYICRIHKRSLTSSKKHQKVPWWRRKKAQRMLRQIRPTSSGMRTAFVEDELRTISVWSSN